jgi:PhnB protein
MMQVHPYLVFNGQCEEAFRFYEKVLGGKIVAMLTHKGTPAEAHVPAEWRDKILHTRLDVGDCMLMGSDAPPDRFEKAAGFSVSLQVKDPAEADRLFNALAEKGENRMPIDKTFWSPRFGMLVDRFGIPWMINCEPQS